MEAQPAFGGEGLDQVHHTRYRVHYWERPSEAYAWNLDAWILSGCTDVHDALTWAAENARGRRYQLFAHASRTAVDDMIVLLLGADPNSPPRSGGDWRFVRAPGIDTDAAEE